MTKKMTGKAIDALHKRVVRQPVLVWDRLTNAEQKRAFAFAQLYRQFLDDAKTERLAAAAIVRALTDNGFVDIQKATPQNKKVYAAYRISTKP